MTMLTLKSVGLCAHYSPVGDRAMRYALALSKRYQLQLNIFAFPQSPFEPHDPSVESDPPSNADRERNLVLADRQLRMYYEDRLGDYLDVGFKVCDGREGTELRRCLKRGEYQLLVIPYLETGGTFGNMPIEEFAQHFLAPVVLVGRWRKVRYYLNAQAVLLADMLNLFRGTWRMLHEVDSSCSIS
jgi:hypothetical protein